MNKTYIAGIVILLGLGGYWMYTGQSAAPTTVTEGPTISAPMPAAPTTETPAAAPTTQTPEIPAQPVPAGITMAEVAKHSTEQNCWTVVSGKVYDVTSVVNTHPGGSKPIIFACGKDGTQGFQRMSSDAQAGAMQQMAPLFKGDLAQ